MSEASKNGYSPLMLATPTFDMGDALLSPLSRTSYGCENDMDNINQFISEFDSRTNTYKRITNAVNAKNLTINAIGTHIALNELQCDICFKILTRKEHLRNHKLLHEPPRIYKCEVCEREFNRRDHLKRHEETHKPKVPKVGNSDLVEKETVEETEPKIVKLLQEPSKVFKCETCQREFNRRDHLKRHEDTHKSKIPKVWNFDLVKNGEVLEETESGNQETIEETEPKIVKLLPEPSKVFKCETCKREFNRRDHLRRHEDTHKAKVPKVWNFHKVKNGDVLEETESGNQKIYELSKHFKCEICGKEFNRRDHLKRHEDTHKPKKVWNYPEVEEVEEDEDKMDEIESDHSTDFNFFEHQPPIKRNTGNKIHTEETNEAPPIKRHKEEKKSKRSQKGRYLNESQEQREARLERMRELNKERRKFESEEKRAKRLEIERLRRAYKLQNESVEMREKRLIKKKESMAKSRNMIRNRYTIHTEEASEAPPIKRHKEERKSKRNQKGRYLNESQEQREARLERMREWNKERTKFESEEERSKRLKIERLRRAYKIQNESVEMREKRLMKKKESRKQREQLLGAPLRQGIDKF